MRKPHFSGFSLLHITLDLKAWMMEVTSFQGVFHIHTFSVKLIPLCLNIPPGRENILNYSAIARSASGNNNKLMYY